MDGELTPFGHVTEVRVYYEDTDFSGAVYHANYLKFCERARSDFLRLLGVHHHELAADGSGFVVRRMLCDFLRPARIDDLLTVETRLREASGARMSLAQSIRRGVETLFTAEVMVAIVDGSGRPRRLPRILAAALSRIAPERPTP